MTTTLDLTGGHLDIRVNPGDGESFVLSLPVDLTSYTWTCTAGLTVTVSATQAVVRIPASVTAQVGPLPSAQPHYVISVRAGVADPITLLSGRLIT